MEPDNKAEDLKGQAKEAAGKAAGNSDLEKEGRRDRANASMKDALDKAKRSIINGVDKAKAMLDKKS